MNFDLSPMQPATSPIVSLTALTGVSPSDDFAALLDRKAIGGMAPEQKAEIGGAATLAQGNASTEWAGDSATALPQSPVDVAKVEPAAALAAIAKADALATRLSPAPQSPEEPATPPEARQLPSALVESARFRPQAELARSERKEPRHEGRATSSEGSAEGEADEAPGSASSAPDIAKIAIEPLPLPMAADMVAMVQAPSRPMADAAISLGALPRLAMPSKSAPAPAAIGNDTGAKEPSPLVEVLESEVEAMTPVAVPKRAIMARNEVEGPDVAEQELPRIVSALASSQGQQMGASKASPVRAAKIAEIALGLAEAQSSPAQPPVQASTPDVASTMTRVSKEISPSDAPVRGTVVERQLDLIRNEQWLGELAHDIASTTGDANRLSFRLMPHQLGRLDVDVSRSHNGLSLSIQTESDSATAILSAAQARLADEIRAQGVKLADTQMFSGDSRQSASQDSSTRPAPLIETFVSPNETVDAPEPEQRDGRYA